MLKVRAASSLYTRSCSVSGDQARVEVWRNIVPLRRGTETYWTRRYVKWLGSFDMS